MLFLCALLWTTVAAKADYYERPCSEYLMNTPGHKDIMALESNAMYKNLSQNIDYQDSLADCIITAASLTGNSESDQLYYEKVSWEYFAYLCNYYKVPLTTSWSDVTARLATNPVNGTSGSQNTRVKIPTSWFEDYDIPAIGLAFYNVRRFPITMGWGLVFYMVGIFGIQICLNFTLWFLPSASRYILMLPIIRDIRWYFTLPPLMSEKSSKWLSNYNQRLHYLWISGLTLLNIAFSVTGYEGQVVSPYYYGDSVHLYSSAIAFRTGYLAMYMLPVSFLFATRNNLLIWLTGWSMDVFNLWHRWISRLVLLQSIAHTSAYYVHYHKSLEVSAAWKEAYWIWGFIVVVCMAIMAVQGMKQIRAIAYDIFVLAHVVLAIICLIGLHVHLWYTDQAKAAWFVCVGFFAADHLIRIVRVFLNGVVSEASISAVGKDAIVMTVPNKGCLKQTPGSYVFVHFMHPLLFWQSHPFTLLPTDDGSVKIVFKPRDGLTKWLLGRIDQQTIKVFIDGPYGVPTNYAPFDTLSFIAGGIGVTAVYSHLMSLSAADISSKGVTFDWIIRSGREIEYFSHELEVLKNLDIEVRIHITSRNSNKEPDFIELGRVGCTDKDRRCSKSAVSNDDKATLLSDIVTLTSNDKHVSLTLLQRIILPYMAYSQKSIAFFVCGPSGLNREARAIVTSQVPIFNSKYIQFYDESFSM